VKLSFVSVPARMAAGLTLALILGIATAGCGGGGYGTNAMGGAGCVYGCPAPTPPAGTDCSAVASGAPVTIDLNVGLAACDDTTYTSVLGFSLDNTHSQVIKIPVNSNVVFAAMTGGPHTADLLGSSFPAMDTNPATAAPAGTDISSANFSTGPLNTGSSSAVYHAAVTGIYYFGCHFHYTSNGMRTVLIVQ
jgi:hypothetical protein